MATSGCGLQVGAGYKWVRATSGCGYNWLAANFVRLEVGAATTGCVYNRVYSIATCKPLPATQREEKQRERERGGNRRYVG